MFSTIFLPLSNCHSTETAFLFQEKCTMFLRGVFHVLRDSVHHLEFQTHLRKSDQPLPISPRVLLKRPLKTIISLNNNQIICLGYWVKKFDIETRKTDQQGPFSRKFRKATDILLLASYYKALLLP